MMFLLHVSRTIIKTTGCYFCMLYFIFICLWNMLGSNQTAQRELRAGEANQQSHAGLQTPI